MSHITQRALRKQVYTRQCASCYNKACCTQTPIHSCWHNKKLKCALSNCRLGQQRMVKQVTTVFHGSRVFCFSYIPISWVIYKLERQWSTSIWCGLCFVVGRKPKGNDPLIVYGLKRNIITFVILSAFVQGRNMYHNV